MSLCLGSRSDLTRRAARKLLRVMTLGPRVSLVR